ncbi:MAG: hypothetical protein ABFD54_05830 [Armatimonadota bacterium]|nr:hypothetical protein [bacterium]
MAVRLETLQFGYAELLTTASARPCPHCGQPMQHFYDDESGCKYAQCQNPECEYLRQRSPLMDRLKEIRKGAMNMPVVTAKEQEFELIPEGKYLFQVTDIEADKGEYGPFVKVKCEIVKPEEVEGVETKGKWISVMASLTISAGDKPSKLYQLTSAAFGREIDCARGEKVDTDDLQGRRFYGLVGHVDKGEKGTFANILNYKADKKQDVMPVGGGEFEVGESKNKDDDDPFEDE